MGDLYKFPRLSLPSTLLPSSNSLPSSGPGGFITYFIFLIGLTLVAVSTSTSHFIPCLAAMLTLLLDLVIYLIDVAIEILEGAVHLCDMAIVYLDNMT
ncbi:hypothetical protein N7528_005246 [Penicillium herquei]|nr:hypothetical protein N7528_005246 [Penicillium herquei]